MLALAPLLLDSPPVTSKAEGCEVGVDEGWTEGWTDGCRVGWEVGVSSVRASTLPPLENPATPV